VAAQEEGQENVNGIQ